MEHDYKKDFRTCSDNWLEFSAKNVERSTLLSKAILKLAEYVNLYKTRNDSK